MRDEEMLQKLLRLKQYETPGSDYFERFLDEFHDRMARESRQRHGVRDRMFAWLEELFPSRRLGWSAAAGGMMAVVAFTFLVSNNGPVAGPALVNNQGAFNPPSLPQPEPVPSSTLASENNPSPIIFPELISPVSYSATRSGELNLATPGQILRRGDRLSLRTNNGDLPATYLDKDTILVMDPDAKSFDSEQQ